MFNEVAAPIIGLINSLLGPLLGLVGAAGAIYCVILGVKFAKAEVRIGRRRSRRSRTPSSASF